MENLLLFTPTKKAHIAKLEDLLKVLLKNGLKISPKKCQLFKTELQYMGSVIFIKDKKVCVKLLRSRIEALQKLNPPNNPKRLLKFHRNGKFFQVCFVWNYKNYLNQYII